MDTASAVTGPSRAVGRRDWRRDVVPPGGDTVGVSAASAIRWRQLVLQQGTPAAKPQGGDRRAARIDANASFILGAIEAKDDVTLVELQALLTERGTPVGIGTLWRFFDRHRITRKKRPRAPPSRTAPTF